MGLPAIFTASTVADQYPVALGSYLQLALPVWSLAGVRIVSPQSDEVRTTREEFETLFQGDLRSVAPAIEFTPAESREMESYTEIRRALYQVAAAA